MRLKVNDTIGILNSISSELCSINRAIAEIERQDNEKLSSIKERIVNLEGRTQGAITVLKLGIDE